MPFIGSRRRPDRQSASKNCGLFFLCAGQVARTFFNDLVSLNKQFFSSAGKRIGETDVELKNAIIEVTTDQGGKAGQAGKLVNDRVINPLGKTVIVYGPNLTKRAGQAIEATGAKVARTAEELKKLLGGQ
jgi:hypothetical protein